MTINFYSLSAKRNELSKTLGTATALTGTLRDPCSLIDPDVLIESATVPAFNYAEISDFHRYYFVTSITAESYHMYRVRMHEDVLMSWKGHKETTPNAGDETGIYGLYAYITRAADVDSTVVDSIYPVEADPYVSKKTATLVTGSPTWKGTSDLDVNTYQLGDTDRRFVFMYQGANRDASDNVLGSYWPITSLMMARREFETFIGMIQSQYVTAGGGTLGSRIYDVYALPTKPTGSGVLASKVDPAGTGNEMTLPSVIYPIGGLKQIEAEIPQGMSQINVVWSFSLSEFGIGKYLNFAPYRRYSLQFLPWGKLDLDPGLVYVGESSPKLYVRVSVDPVSGNAALYYGPGSTNTPYYLGSTNVKITFPVSSESYNATKVVAGVITTVASIASMAATGGATTPAVLGASAGALTAITGAATPNASITGGQQIIIDDAPLLLVSDYNPRQSGDSNLFGFPDNTTRQYQKVTGYCETGRVQIGGTGFAGILEDERRELETILKGGIIV